MILEKSPIHRAFFLDRWEALCYNRDEKVRIIL